ncbi:beta-ketoacyl synthase N-terminal-like domain-containing protein [Gemmatimonadota bacterium]
MHGRNEKRRVVVTGMSINTAIGDNLDEFYSNLLKGQSAITRWKFLDTSGIHSKIGGDLSEYDIMGHLAALAETMAADRHQHLRKLVKKAPFATRIALLCAADAFLDAELGHGLD